MINNRMRNKFVASTLSLALLLGSGTAVITMPTTTHADSSGQETPFLDVSLNYWAGKHIVKLYLQGIIEGYETSPDLPPIFDPENSVSQQEAVTMALRFAKLEDETNQPAIIVFDKSFVVSDWAKNNVELAFTKGMLDRNEEYARAAADESVSWGTMPASREWVTKLIVRALGQAAMAGQLSEHKSKFNDDSLIHDEYRGYVNAAVELGLVKGVTETTFVPGANVNRASLATLFSRAQTTFPVSYEGQLDGIVTSLSESSITLFNDNEEIVYTIDQDTLFYRYDTETPTSINDIMQYGEVTIFASGNRAQYIEVRESSENTESIEGTFGQYNEAEGVIYVWVDGTPIPYKVTDKLDIKDSTGKKLFISDLKSDMAVTVVQDTFRETPEALQIIAEAASHVTSITGQFYTNDSKTITLLTNDQELLSKFVASDAKVEIEGLENAGLEDLIKEEDQVELSLNAEDQVVKVKVLNREVKILVGAEIDYYNADENYITIRRTGKTPISLFLTDKTTYDYLGTSLNQTNAMDLRTQNVNVIIRYTGDAVVSLEYVLKYTGVIEELNLSAQVITIKTEDNVSLQIPIDGAPIEYIGRNQATAANLKVGDTITMGLKVNEIGANSIQVHKTISYKLAIINNIHRQITVSDEGLQSFEFSLQDVEILKADGTAALITQLKTGTTVELNFVGKVLKEVQTSI